VNGRNSREKAQKTQKRKRQEDLSVRPALYGGKRTALKSLHILFLRFLRLFAAISTSVFPLRLCVFA
jgi:hypothetical protein